MLKKKDRHSIHINKHELVYYRCGRGEPILLVHGITTYSFIWRKLVPILEQHYELIIVDLLGCGDSDKSIGIDLSLKGHALVLAQLLEALHIDKVHMVGHDVGGGICQLMAVRFPHLVLSLSMLNSVAYDYWPVQPIITMRTPIIRQLAMATLDLGVFRLIVKRGLYYSSSLTKELMDYFWYPMKSSEGRKAFLYFAHCLDNKDLLEIALELKQLTIPVLIIRGDKDVYLSMQIAEKLHQEIIHSQLHIIETAGHFIQEDEPELTANYLHTFISG
ncbi:alpha/beta fold hydrolase [Carboxylicivirga sp. M1479]|uniref:alpha/beta fold hydrolase n=1 Tax=Carboxylicivirga sp. M1479 TaxID=2594476 RepID=UPI001177F968|nr:alpha/beta hydrolase [Carboxylicivirga sp. M1479]TRX72384.1 alpha/beta hydrolase [Carboxylicivirga sp. M1479]